MGGWFATATIVDWVILIGMTVGVGLRAAEWWGRGKKVLADADSLVTKPELERCKKDFREQIRSLERELQTLLTAKGLEWDRDMKHWLRSQLSSYVPAGEHIDMKRRLDRLEDRIERLEQRERP